MSPIHTTTTTAQTPAAKALAGLRRTASAAFARLRSPAATRGAAFALGLCCLLLASAVEARADAVQLLLRSQLSASASTAAYDQPDFAQTEGPTYALAASLNTLTFTNSGHFEFREDGPGFQTDMADGTRLLLSQGQTGNVTTIDFAAGVTELGFDLQDFPVVGNFQIEVFNGAASLGTFSVADLAGDGLPAFFGVSASDGDVITRVVITGFTGNYAIGPVSFVNGPAAPAEVPEPATILLLGTGLAGATAAARRRRPPRNSS